MSAPPEAAAAETCPECGAPILEGLTCWEKFCYLLGWEAQDAELSARHFLTVASYSLQHPAQLNDEAVAVLRAALIDHLDNGLPERAILRRMGLHFAGARRVRLPADERKPQLRRWSLTIDHAFAGGAPTDAAWRVETWAAAIRSELDEGD